MSFFKNIPDAVLGGLVSKLSHNEIKVGTIERAFGLYYEYQVEGLHVYKDDKARFYFTHLPGTLLYRLKFVRPHSFDYWSER